jgi:hypothetical protein
MLEESIKSNNLDGTNTAYQILRLASNDEQLQTVAYDALDYKLLNENADRPENYGDPKILLKDDTLINVIPVLAEILSEETFNWYAKWAGLWLMKDIYRFATVSKEAKQLSPEKTERIRELVPAYRLIYEQLLTYKNEQVQESAQTLLELISTL